MAKMDEQRGVTNTGAEMSIGSPITSALDQIMQLWQVLGLLGAIDLSEIVHRVMAAVATAPKVSTLQTPCYLQVLCWTL